jgi:glycosyltransferase involved in cell wall biosynthesis
MSPKIVYIAPYYSEAVRRDLRLTAEFSPAGLNKTRGIAACIPPDFELTLFSTGYSMRSGFGRIVRREETLMSGGRPVPVIYPGYRAVRYVSFLEIAAAAFLECRRLKPDLVIFYNFRIETLVPALLAKLFGGARIICQFEDGLQVVFPPGAPRRLAFQALYHLGKRLCDGFTLVNGSLRGEFPASRSVVIPIILPDRAGVVPHFATLDLSSKPVVKIAYSGSLDRQRGADIFLEATRRLRKNPRLRFLMTGRGPLAEQARTQAKSQGNLEFGGLLDDRQFAAFLRDVDILVNPQKLGHPFARYSFPSKVASYILLNKPIVSTAFSDISDVPAPGLFFYGDDDPADLSRVLEELADREIDVDYRALFEKFSESKTREALRKLFQRLAAARP